MRKLENADAEMMRIAIQQEITLSDELRYDHRLHGLLLITEGQSCCPQVAELFGEDRRTVQRPETHGLADIREDERPGRSATLDAKQWMALRGDLRRDPEEFGHASGPVGWKVVLYSSSLGLMGLHGVCTSVRETSVK